MQVHVIAHLSHKASQQVVEVRNLSRASWAAGLAIPDFGGDYDHLVYYVLTDIRLPSLHIKYEPSSIELEDLRRIALPATEQSSPPPHVGFVPCPFEPK